MRVPEHARQERALELADGQLVAAERCRRIEAVQQPADHQLALDRLEGAEHARMIRWQETHQRDEQRGRVQGLVVITLPESVLLLVPAPFHDLGMDRSRFLAPARELSHLAPPGLFGDPYRAFEYHPGQHPAGHVVGLFRQFPDAAAGFLPVPAGVFRRAAYQVPMFRRQLTAILQVQAHAIRHVGKRTELTLSRRPVAHAHGQAVPVAAHPFDGALFNRRASVHAVDHLQGRIGSGLQVGHPVQVTTHLVGLAQTREEGQGQ